MLILSKSKDYYDGVVGSMGIDKTIVYDRKLAELDKDDKDFPEVFLNDGGWGYYSKKKKSNGFINNGYYFRNVNNIDYFYISFCGKMYLGIKHHIISDAPYVEDTTEIIYDVDRINKLIKDDDKYNKKKGDYFNIKNIENFDSHEIHRKFNTPVFIYYVGDYNKRFIINPNLKEFKFYKVIDSFQAFQEIQMFIGGVLGSSGNEMIEIADKYKIKKHGFDKWSFRKEPQKKK